MLWWDHVTTVHQNILGQQQEALRGEQVGQGWAAVLSFLPDELPAIPCYCHDLHHCAETSPLPSPVTRHPPTPSPSCLPGSLGRNLWKIWRESGTQGFRAIPALGGETGFLPQHLTHFLCPLHWTTDLTGATKRLCSQPGRNLGSANCATSTSQHISLRSRLPIQWDET